MENKELLLENIKEFLKEAKEASLNSSFNSSVTLYFKAMAVIADLFILKEKRFIPNSHKERFEILKNNYQEIYKIIDKDFPIYQQSYRIKLGKEYVTILENDIKKLLELTEIKV